MRDDIKGLIVVILCIAVFVFLFFQCANESRDTDAPDFPFSAARTTPTENKRNLIRAESPPEAFFLCAAIAI